MLFPASLGKIKIKLFLGGQPVRLAKAQWKGTYEFHIGKLIFIKTKVCFSSLQQAHYNFTFRRCKEERTFIKFMCFLSLISTGGVRKADFREWIKADFREWIKADFGEWS